MNGDSDRHLDRKNQPTLKTIAMELGLGVTTVSRALKDGPELSIQTRRNVQELARRLGYRTNRAGLGLRTGKTNVIALVLDAQEQIGSFVSEMIFGITEGLSGTPYHLMIRPYTRAEDAMKPIRHLVETGSADGIIISRIEPNDERVHYLIEHGVPFATHGRTQVGLQHPFFDFDNRAFAQIAVRKLAALGRHRIALFGPPAGLSFENDMKQGFLSGLHENGLSEVTFDIVNNDNDVDQIIDASCRLFETPDRPDGIVSGAGGVSGTGGATFAILMGLEKAGLHPGRDVDVVAKRLFRRLPMMRQELHVVYEDVREAGHGLAKSLIGAIDGRPVEELQTLVVPNQVFSPARS